jgi:hypothetical protein
MMNQLVDKTLTLMKNQNREISTEAAFVITNALSTSSNTTLLSAWAKKGAEITEAFSRYLNNYQPFNNDQRILRELFGTILNILEIQREQGISNEATSFREYFMQC